MPRTTTTGAFGSGVTFPPREVLNREPAFTCGSFPGHHPVVSVARRDGADEHSGRTRRRGVDRVVGRDGRGAEVDLGIGPTPDAATHVHLRSVPVSEASVRLDGLGPVRQYVSMRVDGSVVVLAAERRVPFEGIQNFRDLGGYATTDGGTVRWGQLFAPTPCTS